MPESNNLEAIAELQQLESDPIPAWVFDIEQRTMWWANPAGLSFWKADSVADLRARNFKDDSAAVVNRLNTLFQQAHHNEFIRESWTLFPRGEPVNVLADHTFFTIEGERQAVLLRIVQYLDGASDQKSMRLIEATRHTPVLICAFNVEGVLLTENPAAMTFFGGMSLGSNRTLADHIGSVEQAQTMIDAILRDEAYEGERVVNIGNRSITLHISARRGLDPVTGEIAMFLTEQDVTEQNRLANQLTMLNERLENRVAKRAAQVEQRQAWYKSLFDHAADALLIRDIDTMEIAAANPAAAAMFGVTQAELLEGDFDPLKKKQEMDAAHNVEEDATKGGLQRALDNGEEILEATFYRANGQPFPAKVSLIPFPDPERNLIRASIVDLSDRKQDEERYRAIFDSASEAIVINDIDDRTGFVEMNPQAEKLFGVGIEEFQSGRRNFYDFSPAYQPDGRNSVRTAPEYTQAALRDGTTTFEWTFLNVDGKATECQMTMTPFPHPTKRLILSTIVDISERKRSEQTRRQLEDQLVQAQKLEALGQLTGGVAHDFNNLLAVILGNIELLQESNIDDHQAALIRSALAATERGAKLTRSMLAFALRSDLQPKELEIGKVLEDLNDWLTSTIPDNIKVTTNSESDISPINADISGIERSLLNLVINARDAMPLGGEINIYACNISLEANNPFHLTAGPYVCLCVSDTGSGIPKASLSRVFEPFFSTKEVNSNSGLGLSMVHGFMTQSGGAVAIDSEPHQGTRVRLMFPAVTQSNHPDVVDREEIKESERQLKILVAEDQQEVLTILVHILEAEGHEVISATSGDHALRLFSVDEHFDLLITDIDMPGKLQGPDLARKLRLVDNELPVIFLSGYSAGANLIGDGLTGLEHSLMKPVTRRELIQAITDATRSVSNPPD